MSRKSNELCPTDINECLTLPCDENADCENLDGSFKCTCKSGYRGTGLECEGTLPCDHTGRRLYQCARYDLQKVSYVVHVHDSIHWPRPVSCVHDPIHWSRSVSCVHDSIHWPRQCRVFMIRSTGLDQCRVFMIRSIGRDQCRVFMIRSIGRDQCRVFMIRSTGLDSVVCSRSDPLASFSVVCS